MKFAVLTFLVAVSQSQNSNSCKKIDTHVEWRELTTAQQNNYLKAVNCLRNTKSAFPKLGGTSAYEDLVAAHAISGPKIHTAPAFLPWHRAFLAIHDELLRTKCGYTDPMPYWDWTFDSQAPDLSPIWKSFGTQTNGCISMPKLGELNSNYPNKHCVRRKYVADDKNGNALLSPQYSPTQMALILESSNYDKFRQALEVGPHNNIHGALGGDMSITTSSPNDPIFFLHHRNIDRIWWKWQRRHKTAALTYEGKVNGQTVKKSDTMNFQGLHPNINVGAALDVASGKMDGKLCYKYSNSITAKNRSNGRKSASFAKNRNIAIGIANTETPDQTDRSELFNLREPATLDDDFIKSMNFTNSDIKKLRETEAIVKKFTKFVNRHQINFPANLGELISANESGVRSKTDDEEEAEIKQSDSLIDQFKLEFKIQF